MNLAQATLSPGTDGHPLGTDASGYDVLRRLMVAGQISLEVGIAAALLATLVGVLWGAIAGYFGGALETVMMRIVDAMLAIPTLFLALVVVAIVSPNEAILILVIALTSWLTTPRLVRGEAVSLRVREYVQAMKVMGGSGIRAATRHIAPNAVGTIMVNATFQPTRSPLSSRSATWGSASRHRSRSRAACGLELAQHGRYPAAGPAELADTLHAQLVDPCGPAGQLLSAQLIGQSRED